MFEQDSNGNDVIDFTDIRQGGASTCYIKSSMAAIAEFPDLIKKVFVNSDRNEEGIYSIRLFIRGKPWIVTVDDYMLFDSNDNLVFAKQSYNGKSIWGALLEKAWAKVKGNYINTNYGYTINGIRTLTGVPTFAYEASSKTLE